jgi:hypothetical protein
MQQIETTPWYPTVRLFRQRSPGNWAGVLQRVIGELSDLRNAGLDQALGKTRRKPENAWLVPV